MHTTLSNDDSTVRKGVTIKQLEKEKSPPALRFHRITYFLFTEPLCKNTKAAWKQSTTPIAKFLSVFKCLDLATNTGY